MYSELIIRPSKLVDQVIYPDTARKLLAEALDGVAVPPLLFNRTADGKTIQDKYWHEDKGHLEAALPYPPVVSFDGGKGFLRLYMLGQPGRELLMETASIIGAAVGKHVGGPYSFAMNEGDCTIKQNHTPILYSIRRLVVTKDPHKAKRYIKVPPSDVEDDLRRIVMRGLISQARWLDANGASKLELEYAIPDKKKLEYAIPDENTLGFTVADGMPTPIEIKEGTLAAGYKNLVFSMNLDLMGPWFSGHLRSRGYGHIRKLVLPRGGAR